MVCVIKHSEKREWSNITAPACQWRGLLYLLEMLNSILLSKAERHLCGAPQRVKYG